MRLRELRDILNLKQKDIADILGIKKNFISMVENKKRNLTISHISLLEKTLGVSVDWLSGKNKSLFSDWQKGIEYLKEKTFLTKWEILFLIEVVQHVWSISSGSTKKEHVMNLLKALIYIANNCYIKNLNNLHLETCFAESRSKDIFEVIKLIENKINEQNECEITIADSTAKALLKILKEGDLVLNRENEQVISDLLLPWGYFVALSYIPLKQEMQPLSSLYFSISDTKLEQKESFVLEKAKELAFLEHKENRFFIIFKEKGSITCSNFKGFGLFTLLQLSQENKDRNLKVLDYEFSFDPWFNKFKLRQGDLTIFLTLDEYQNLVEIIKEIKENKTFWNYLQKIFLEKFGFI